MDSAAERDVLIPSGVRIRRWARAVMVLWAVILLVSLGWNIHIMREHELDRTRTSIRTHYMKDLTLRQWVSRHGGVYVPVSEHTKPDPYTDFLPDRDVVTQSGRRLTLLNPALVLRQYYEMAEKEFGIRSHLFSRKPLNPQNDASPIEVRALQRFTDGRQELWRTQPIGGEPYMRLMRPIFVKERCLKCHGHQGYEVGQVAGGVSVAVPLQETAVTSEYLALTVGHAIFFVLGLVGIGGGARLLERQVTARDESEAHTVAVLGATRDAVITIAPDHRVRYWNSRAEAIFGWEAGTMTGQPLETFLTDDAITRIRDAVAGTSGADRSFETTARHRNGEPFPVELVVAPVTQAGQSAYSILIRDITQRKADEQRLRREYESQHIIARVLETAVAPKPFEARLQDVLDTILSTPWLSIQAKGMIFLADSESRELRLAASQGIGENVYRACQTVPYGECLCGIAATEQQLLHRACVNTEHSRQFPGMHNHGHYIVPIESEHRLLGLLNLYIDPGHERKPDEEEFLTALGHTLGAMIERHEAEQQLHYNAYYDNVTGLPNRGLFMDRLNLCIRRRARNPDYLFAVLFCDLDRFKNINDSLGHAAGDEVLRTLGERLRSCVRPNDTVSRLAGDEFTLILDGIEDRADGLRVAERVHEAMARPFPIDGKEIFCSVSIGVALGDTQDYADADQLLRDADIAMYRSKTGNGATGQTALFDRAMHEQAMERLTMETELRQAIAGHQFTVHYQPIVHADSGAIQGFEALARWHHPERGPIPPGSFIPVAEEIGLIDQIAEQVLFEACRQLRDWHRRFPHAGHPYVSVNLSPNQFRNGAIVEQVADTVEAAGLDSRHLRLEITENLLLDEPEAVRDALHRLKALGIGIYIDDFGKGYSSLNYLRTFPFDTLKIDRSFIGNLTEEKQHVALVEAITTIARNFGMDTIAEGVETAGQLDLLRSLGCSHIQGFLFHRPQPASQIDTLLGTNPV